MTRKRRDRPSQVASLFVAFSAGIVFAWWLQLHGPPKPASGASGGNQGVQPQATNQLKPAAGIGVAFSPLGSTPSVAGASPAIPVGTSGNRPRRRLNVPIEGADVESWKGGFYERRDGRPHEAIDILAPRNTPVHAVEAGTVEKLFFSKAGGNTVYQFDPDGRLCYYYAHLERYADGLHEGQTVAQNEVIGYVGTSGNAPANTPHLHFAVFQLNPDRHWWQGTPLDPYEVFHR